MTTNKKGEFWQIDDEKSFEIAISSELFAKEEEEEKCFCKRFFYLPAYFQSSLEWWWHVYDDQHQSRGEITDEKEIFVTVTYNWNWSVC